MLRILAILISLTLISCSKEVEIVFPTKFVKENSVILNDEFNLENYTSSNDYSSINIRNGEINVEINGESKSIKTKNGGILNLNKEEFVIFPVIYGSTNFTNMMMPHSVIVDSTLYFKNQRGFDEAFFLKHHVKDGSDRNAYKLTNAMSAITKETFFYEKRWDISINDEVPKQITERRSEYDLDNGSGSRSVLRSAQFFKMYATLSGEYSTIDIRNDTIKIAMEQYLKEHLAKIESKEARKKARKKARMEAREKAKSNK